MSLTTTTISQRPLQLLPQPFSPGGLGGGATGFNTGFVPVASFSNGRLRGNAHQDQTGTLLIEFANEAGNVDLAFTVTQDVSQPDVQYPFDVIVMQPFLRVSFVNGGVASSFFRANVVVLSI